jgi:hypothetical protein
LGHPLRKIHVSVVITVTLCAVLSAGAKGKNKQESEKKPQKAVQVDVAHFDGVPLPIINEPIDTEQLPDFGQTSATYANASRGERENAIYFRAPESVRESREESIKENLKMSERTLYKYIREQRTKDFGDEFASYEAVIKKNQEILASNLLIKRKTAQEDDLSKKFDANPELKEALGFFGLVRLHSAHGNFNTAPTDVKAAHEVEYAFHHYSDDRGSPLRTYNANFGVSKEAFTFDPTKASAELRTRGLELVWDLREILLPDFAKNIDEKLSEELKVYAPYERIYIDAFKKNAMAKGSPEFIAIWKSIGSPRKYRRELLAIGLITTGSVTSPHWNLYGPKNQPGNTPDGVWRLARFHQNHSISVPLKKGGFSTVEMRGAMLLSYANSPAFSGRAFHLVFFHSNWGTNGSHGCYRTYTRDGKNGYDRFGLANVIWAAVNPMQLDEVDHADFGNDGDVDEYRETPFIREIVRTMRDRVWISNFSDAEEGYRFTGDATYSVQIRRQYENFSKQTGIYIAEAANKLMNSEQKIAGPTSTRIGKYWVYNKDTLEKTFKIDFTKPGELPSREEDTPKKKKKNNDPAVITPNMT